MILLFWWGFTPPLLSGLTCQTSLHFHPCLIRAHPEFPGQHQREPLPSTKLSLSDLTFPPLSGSNRIPHPQRRYVSITYLQLLVNTSKCGAQPSHRHYPPSLKDKEAFPSTQILWDLS